MIKIILVFLLACLLVIFGYNAPKLFGGKPLLLFLGKAALVSSVALCLMLVIVLLF